MIKRIVNSKHNLISIGAILFALLVLFYPTYNVEASEVEENACGTSLTWFYEDGVLTIEGIGSMYNYDDIDFAPWYDYREEISYVSLPDGLYLVGDFAFYNCTNLKSVTLPDTVVSIGEKSFMDCTELVVFNTGSSVMSIGESAFDSCVNLKSISLPSSLKYIAYKAFYRCESLVSITVPSSVNIMGETVFAYCDNLIQANIQANITELPTWTFYGCYALTTVTLSDTITSAGVNCFYSCDSLNTIYYSLGEETTQEELLGNMSLEESVSIKNPSSSSDLVSSNTQEYDNMSTTATVKDSDNILIENNAVYENDILVSNQYDVIIENQDGMSEIVPSIGSQASSVTTEVNVTMSEGVMLTKDVLVELAGENISLNIQTSNNAIWQIDCSEIDVDTLIDEYNFEIIVERIMVATDLQLATIGTCEGYSVYFSQSFELPITVLIPLETVFAKENGTLYLAQDIGMIQTIDTVVIDNEGYASYTMGNVISEIEYIVGINSIGISSDEVTVPNTLTDDYGDNVEYIEPVTYEITGTTSNLGIDITQFTWIVLGGLIFIILVVGVVMLVMNRMKINKLRIQAEYSMGEDNE